MELNHKIIRNDCNEIRTKSHFETHLFYKSRKRVQPYEAILWKKNTILLKFIPYFKLILMLRNYLVLEKQSYINCIALWLLRPKRLNKISKKL